MSEGYEKIMESLKKEAANKATVTGSGPLEAFNLSSAGAFPYYWTNPNNLEFNHKTYDWIKKATKAGKDPVETGDSFNTLFETAIQSIEYGLSTDDTAKKNQIANDATNQQLALLTKWKNTYGGFPEGEGQPIDKVVGEILTKWSSKELSLSQLQDEFDLNEFFDTKPASAGPIIPIFSNWLDAIGDGAALMNATSLNSNYVKRAQKASQKPSLKNGGMKLDDGADFHPAYQVNKAATEILNDLKQDSNSISVDFEVKESSESKVKVEVNASTTVEVRWGWFFKIKVKANADYFKETIVKSSSSMKIKMTFPGISFVPFGPVEFEKSTLKGWYYQKAIKDAIKNTGKDVTGFRFSPDPNIDFSANGDFRHLTGVAISQQPTIEVTLKSSNSEHIKETLNGGGGVGITLLGLTIDADGKNNYTSKVTDTGTSNEIKITFGPSKEINAVDNVDGRAWILGVQRSEPLFK